MHFKQLLKKGEVSMYNGGRGSLTDLIYFYKSQLEKFKKIGLGNKTEFNVVVTDRLIDTTIRRLKELKGSVYDLHYVMKGRQNGVK